LATGALLLLTLTLSAGSAAAHERRHVRDFEMVVGFIGEPVFTGQKSGLEFSVSRGEEPVTGLADTLQAEAIYGDQRRDLEISPRFGQDGWYQSVFFPTAAGAYTFRIFGTIEGQQVDESFTSAEDTFSVVEEQSGGQFPVVLPATAELAADAERGAAAADQIGMALGLGAAGLIVGLIAIGLALAIRRRPA
jgi:hypothetical protein